MVVHDEYPVLPGTQDGPDVARSTPSQDRCPVIHMLGYEAINRLLCEAGVETTFQYMAEDTMELVADLKTNEGYGIDVVHSRHEQGAMAMADAYARAGDRIGVCVVGRGPGIAQTGTALVNARKNGSRLLVIVPTPAHTDAHDPKEFEQDMFLQSTAGNVVTVRSEGTLASTVSEAIRRVHLGDGPLAVQVPKDILKGTVDTPPDVGPVSSRDDEHDDRRAPSAPAMSRPPAPRLEPDPEQIAEAVDLYLDSDAYQPSVVLVGEGAAGADAKEPIEALAERLNAVLVTSLKGRDYFEDHPFSLGFSGNWGSPLANEFLSEANYVLAIGCSLNNHTVDRGTLIDDDATVVHVDIDPKSIGRYTPVDVGIVADARLAVEALMGAVEEADIDRGRDLWTDRLRDRIEAYSPLDEREYPEKQGVMDPRELMRKLEAVLPDARLVGTDGGQFRKWALHELSAPPEDSIISCDFAAIGLGLPMGVGLGQFLKDRNRSGSDDRTAVAICGDGGFMMSVQELETAARHDVPVVVVVGNDSSLGSEYHYLDVQGGPAEIARLSTPSIAGVAEMLGAESHTITHIDELDDIEDRLRRPEGPVVVECLIDHEVRHHSY